MVFLVRNNYIKQGSTLELFPEMISLIGCTVCALDVCKCIFRWRLSK